MSSKWQEERNEKIIRGLMKLPPNRRCINCNSLGPQYVCTNFWTFVCMICSGIHREFTHRVKSVSVSKFTSLEVESLQNGGNQRAREIFLKDWDLHRQRQPNSSDVDKVREFIKSVYVNHKYAGGNNSEKSSGDTQTQRNTLDETRRSSSYHSFSQSPPYDFQYEDRLNRKHTGSLTRKPGSDNNLFDRKAASFIYSPGHLSEHFYEDRYANDGSSSRISDYSLSSNGDPFKSAPQSPNLQKDDGFLSPTSDSSREIVDGLHHQTSSTNSEINAKKDIDKAPLPRPQSTVSSGSVGSFHKNSVSLQSTESGSLLDVKLKPNHSNTPTQNKVSPSPFGGLDLFEDALVKPALNSTLGVDRFQVLRTEPVASMDLFESPAASSALSQNFAQTSYSSSSSLLSQISQNLPVSNPDQKLSGLSEPRNEGWATFDSFQPSPPYNNTIDTGGSRAGSEGGESLKYSNSAAPSNDGLLWLDFPSSSALSPPLMVSNPWNADLQNVHPPTNIPSSQIWNAFEEPNKQLQYVDTVGKSLQVSVDNISSNTSLFSGSKTPQDSVIDGPQLIASSEGFSFPILPSHFTAGSSFFEPLHPFMNDVANVRQNSCNPFDVPFDSEMEGHNMFLDMSKLQAALPSTPLPSSSFTGGIDEPWFSANAVASPGGMSFMTTQAPSSQLQNVPTHGPVASVGGNPFA